MKPTYGLLVATLIFLSLAGAGCMSEKKTDTGSIPQGAFDWNGKGVDAYAKENYTEALEFFDRAIQADPGFSKAWNNRGMTLIQLGRYEEAAAAFNRTLEIDPLYPGAKENRDAAMAMS